MADIFTARHTIACFMLGVNILPHRWDTRRLLAIDACRQLGYRLYFRMNK